MNLSAGKILIATNMMDDPNFRDTVIFITEYNEGGAMGLGINKIFERPLYALDIAGGIPANWKKR